MDKRLNGRVWLLDEIRGVAILLMVLYHTGYDLVAIFGLDLSLIHIFPGPKKKARSFFTFHREIVILSSNAI